MAFVTNTLQKTMV